MKKKEEKKKKHTQKTNTQMTVTVVYNLHPRCDTFATVAARWWFDGMLEWASRCWYRGRMNKRNMGETTWWISTTWSCHPSWPSTNHMTMWLIFHLRGLPWLLIPSPSTTNGPTAGLFQHSSKPPPGCNSAATVSQRGWRFQMMVTVVWALGIYFLFFWYVFLFFFFLLHLLLLLDY